MLCAYMSLVFHLRRRELIFTAEIAPTSVPSVRVCGLQCNLIPHAG
jgi:hypothetical protein